MLCLSVENYWSRENKGRRIVGVSLSPRDLFPCQEERCKPMARVLDLILIVGLGAIWDFPGRPVIKTPHFQCSGCGFDPWSGN